MHHGCKTRLQTTRQFGLNEAGRVLQAMQAQLLLACCPHNGDVNFGMLKVPGNLGSCHRYALDARIAKREQDRFTGHFADHLSNTRHAVWLHVFSPPGRAEVLDLQLVVDEFRNRMTPQAFHDFVEGSSNRADFVGHHSDPKHGKLPMVLRPNLRHGDIEPLPQAVLDAL